MLTVVVLQLQRMFAFDLGRPIAVYSGIGEAWLTVRRALTGNCIVTGENTINKKVALDHA